VAKLFLSDQRISETIGQCVVERVRERLRESGVDSEQKRSLKPNPIAA
jgi:hypothetical protein